MIANLQVGVVMAPLCTAIVNDNRRPKAYISADSRPETAYRRTNCLGGHEHQGNIHPFAAIDSCGDPRPASKKEVENYHSLNSALVKFSRNKHQLLCRPIEYRRVMRLEIVEQFGGRQLVSLVIEVTEICSVKRVRFKRIISELQPQAINPVLRTGV